MKNECRCDMRGLLSFQILYLLSKKPMHGNEIAEEIEKRRDNKPKAGTIYPALKDLKTKGFIKGEEKGKTIVYSITPVGSRAFKKAKDYFVKCFGDIIEK